MFLKSFTWMKQTIKSYFSLIWVNNMQICFRFLKWLPFQYSSLISLQKNSYTLLHIHGFLLNLISQIKSYFSYMSYQYASLFQIFEMITLSVFFPNKSSKSSYTLLRIQDSLRENMARFTLKSPINFRSTNKPWKSTPICSKTEQSCSLFVLFWQGVGSIMTT